MKEWEGIINKAWEDKNLLKDKNVKKCIENIIEELDKGKLRVSNLINNKWKTNEWIKKAIILYFPMQEMQTIEVGLLQGMVHFYHQV